MEQSTPEASTCLAVCTFRQMASSPFCSVACSCGAIHTGSLHLFSSVHVQTDGIFTVLLRGPNFSVNLGQAGWDQGTCGHLNWNRDRTCSDWVRHCLDSDRACTKWQFTRNVCGGITLARGQLDACCLDRGNKMSRCHLLIHSTSAGDDSGCACRDTCWLHISNSGMLSTTIIPSHCQGSSLHRRDHNRSDQSANHLHGSQGNQLCDACTSLSSGCCL